MSEKETGIYLIVYFDWPTEMDAAAKVARKLHSVVKEAKWIENSVTATSGIGGDHHSIWVFWLENYSHLEKLTGYNESKDPVGEVYQECFTEMKNVRETVKNLVYFPYEND